MYSSELDTGYAVLRLVTDVSRGTTIPVGTVAWDRQKQWYRVRLLRDEEKVHGVNKRWRLLLSLVESKLMHWAKEGVVPYTNLRIDPWTGAFWDLARHALTTGIRLDAPKAMEETRSEEDLDLLFEAIVKPDEAPSKLRKRTDGALRRALGSELVKQTTARLEVRAFKDAREQVTRGVRGAHGVVLLEAVNLAGKHARRDADAIASKLMRILDAQTNQHEVHTIVGYMASPGGLNGETHMKEWLRERVTPHVYDLSRDDETIRLETAQAIAAISDQGKLSFDQR